MIARSEEGRGYTCILHLHLHLHHFDYFQLKRHGDIGQTNNWETRYFTSNMILVVLESQEILMGMDPNM